MTDVIFLTLLTLHIATVVAWMGGALLFVSVIFPSLRRLSPASRGEFMASALPRYINFVSRFSLAAIVTGLVLYWDFLQGSSLAPSDPALISIQVGGVFGVIALIVMFGVSRPSAMRMLSLTKQMATGPNDNLRGQLAGLQRKSVTSGILGLALLGASLVIMIVGAEL